MRAKLLAEFLGTRREDLDGRRANGENGEQ